MCSVLQDPMLLASMKLATVASKVGVGNTVKRKDVLETSIPIVQDVALVTAPLRYVTAIQDGPAGGVKSLLAPVPQCAAAMERVRPLDLNHSVLVIRGGWVELVRPNVNMVLPRKQATVYSSASVMVATVV